MLKICSYLKNLIVASVLVLHSPICIVFYFCFAKQKAVHILRYIMEELSICYVESIFVYPLQVKKLCRLMDKVQGINTSSSLENLETKFSFLKKYVLFQIICHLKIIHGKKWQTVWRDGIVGMNLFFFIRRFL